MSDFRVPGYSVDVESYKKPVTKIKESKFYKMLGVLPPENWQKIGKEGEYFQMSEYEIEDLTAYYVHLDNNYYTFIDKAWMKPIEVLNKISEHVLEHGAEVLK